MKLFSTHISSWGNTVVQLVNGRLVFAFTDLVCSSVQVKRDLINWHFMELVNNVIPVYMLPYLSCLTPVDKERITGNSDANRETMTVPFKLRKSCWTDLFGDETFSRPC